eukprot:NODE_29_length_37665_cov_1.081563.p34 type:complete len:101 gc:universal NODE_29_length_37665_cov_1.081563:19711-20013(+)
MLPLTTLTWLAINTSLWLNSLTPKSLKPLTPPALVFWSFPPLRISTPPNLREYAEMSGIASRHPLMQHLSPAFAVSTMSPRQITSIVLGMAPLGISSELS